ADLGCEVGEAAVDVDDFSGGGGRVGQFGAAVERVGDNDIGFDDTGERRRDAAELPRTVDRRLRTVDRGRPGQLQELACRAVVPQRDAEVIVAVYAHDIEPGLREDEPRQHFGGDVIDGV